MERASYLVVPLDLVHAVRFEPVLLLLLEACVKVFADITTRHARPYLLPDNGVDSSCEA